SSASLKRVCAVAYSPLQVRRVLARCAASAGNFFSKAVHNSSPDSADGDTSSVELQPVASLSWAKNKTRMTNEISTERFEQQFSAGEHQHHRQHAAESDAAPAARSEMRAEQCADNCGQRQPE